MGKITFHPDHTISAIYSPDVGKVLEGVGDVTTRRASHVEPYTSLSDAAKWWLVTNKPTETKNPNAWFADLLPVSGPVLGPFETNTEALAAEIAWLNEAIRKSDTCITPTTGT